jgi:integrase
VRPIAPTTVASYRAAMDRYILPALGKLPVRQVDAATLDTFYADLRSRADVQPPQAEDAARLLSAAMEESPELGLFRHLAVVLGARRGEIISLRWLDIDLDRGEVLIAGNVVPVPRQALVHKDTKTHAKRRVAVGTGTVELLRARRVAQAKDALACGTTLAADAYVFSHVPDGSKPIDPRRHHPPLPAARPPPRRALPPP